MIAARYRDGVNKPPKFKAGFRGSVIAMWRFPALLVGLAVASGCNAAEPSASPSSPQASITDSDWPMFRGGPALLGVAGGSLPASLNLLWKIKTAGPVKSSAAIVKDRVFVGSNDGNVYAFDLANGAKVWTFKTGGAVESSP